MLKGLGQTKDTNERPASVNKPARLIDCCGFQLAVSLSRITLGLSWNLSGGGEDHLEVKGDSVGVGIITWGLMGNLRNWGRSPGIKGGVK